MGKIIKNGIEYSSSVGITKTVIMNTFASFFQGDMITLLDDADKYDELIIYFSHNETYGGTDYYVHRGVTRIDKETVEWSISESALSGEWRGLIDCIGCFQNTSVYSAFGFRFTDKRTMLCVSKTVGTWANYQCGIEKIIGVKYS